MARGTLRRMIWTTTHDMPADGLTKELQDKWVLRKIVEHGRFDTQYSSLCRGELWEPEKGLPPPKSARVKDQAALESADPEVQRSPGVL